MSLAYGYGGLLELLRNLARIRINAAFLSHTPTSNLTYKDVRIADVCRARRRLNFPRPDERKINIADYSAISGRLEIRLGLSRGDFFVINKEILHQYQ